MGFERTGRIAEEIKKVITDLLIERKIKDVRVTDTMSLVSVTSVEVVRDLKYAYVYISVLGNDTDKVMEGFQSAAGYIRKEVGKKVNLRYTPEMVFRVDDSIERGIHMSRLIDDLKIPTEEAEDE